MTKPNYKTIIMPEEQYDRLLAIKSDFIGATDIKVVPWELLKLLLDEHDSINKDPSEEG